MTLSGKRKTSSKPKKFRVSLLEATDEGLTYLPGQTGEIKWKYPIYIGQLVVHSLSPYPLKVEFIKEGKSYYFVFYEPKLGMVAKAKIHGKHATYILRELVSRKGKVPQGGFIAVDKLDKILTDSREMKIWK